MTEYAPRPVFVTVLAWIFIVISGFAVATSALQNALYWLVFPREAMRAATHGQAAHAAAPAVFEFVTGHFEWILLSFLVLALLMLVASIGLLRRKNWARLLFMALLAVGILWNVGGLLIQQMFFPPNLPSQMPADAREQFQNMQFAARAAGTVFALAMSVIFAWLIWRLRSPSLVNEFDRGPHTP